MMIALLIIAAIAVVGITGTVTYRMTERRIRKEYSIDTRIDAAYEMIGENYRILNEIIQDARRELQKNIDDLDLRTTRKFEDIDRTLEATER